MARKPKIIKPASRAHATAQSRRPAGGWIWVARLCFAAAAGVAAWLLFYTLTEKPMAGCGPGSPCDRVMGSSWAYWLDVPVSAPALVVYFTLLVSSMAVTSRIAHRANRAWAIGFMGSILVIAVASWFVYLQVAVIKSVCKFCTAAHVLSVVGAILFLAKAPRPAPMSWVRKISFASIALLPFAALAAAQKFAPHKINTVTLYRGTLKFDLREAPIIGSPDSKSFVISLYDYTCPDCHDMHAQLMTARERLTNSFSIISLPCPLDSTCNSQIRTTNPRHKDACEYARLGLAMRRVSSEAFQKYDDWFFSRGSIVSLNQARLQAETLAGKPALDQALADPWVDQMLQKGISVYLQNGRETRSYRVPQLIVGDAVNMGPTRNVDDLLRLLNEHLPKPNL